MMLESVGKELSDVLQAVSLAAVTAFVRVSWDGKEKRWQRKLLEGSFCGLITLGFVGLCKFFGWDSSITIFFGGVVGGLGSDWVRDLAKKVFERRFSK